MNDDEKARAEQAAKLRKEIELLRKRRPRPPRSPHEFVEEQMRKQATEAAENDEQKPGEGPTQTESG